MGDPGCGAENVGGGGVGPVTQRAIGEGFTHFAARELGVGRGRAVDRRPEADRAVFRLEVVILITASQRGCLNGGRRHADRDGQVPGGEVDHGGYSDGRTAVGAPGISNYIQLH